jgi:DNA-binding CsgD family transcriptional regulator
MVAAGGPRLERLEPTWSSWLRLVLVRASLALGRRAEAVHWTEAIEEVAARHGLAVSAARGVVARAELALHDGDPAAAIASAREALAVFTSRSYRVDELPTRVLLGRALAAAGEEEEARAVLRDVADDASALGTWRFRDAAAAELRRLGVRLSTGAGPRGERDELTEREREIAALVADGRSNKQVAAALFVSEKTVEHHLSRAYAKLGVRTRRELAELNRRFAAD